MSETRAPTCGSCAHRIQAMDQRAREVGLHNCRLVPVWHFVGDRNPDCMLFPTRYERRRDNGQ